MSTHAHCFILWASTSDERTILGSSVVFGLNWEGLSVVMLHLVLMIDR